MATTVNKNKVIAAAQKFVQKGQYDKAIKEYAKIVEEDPRDVRIWLKIGDLHAKKNATKEAVETYSKVAEFYSEQGFYLKAVAVYKQILKIDSNLVEMNLRLAELYKQLGLLSDAMQQYEQVSNFYHQAGRTKEALSALRQIVDLDPENVATRIKLAELYSKEEMKDEAVEEFSKAADYLRAENRLDDFVKVAERLVFHQPQNMLLIRELAGIYLRKKDPRRALQKLQLSFKADPRDEETLELLAQAFEDLGQLQKTLSVLKELANICTENGQEIKRQEIYRRILSLSPQDDDARKALSQDLQSAPEHEPHRGHVAPVAEAPPVELNHPEPRQPPVDPYTYEESVSYRESAVKYSYETYSANDLETFEPPEELPEPSSSEVYPLEQRQEAREERREGRSAPPSSFSDEVAKILTEADVYIKYGLHEKAVDHLRQVFSRDPNNLEVHLKLKDLYLNLGRFGEASRELLFLARCFFETDRRVAVGYLQHVVQIDPGNREAQSLLGTVQGDAIPTAKAMYNAESNLEELEPIDLDVEDIVEEIPIDSADVLADSQHFEVKEEPRSYTPYPPSSQGRSGEYQEEYSTLRDPLSPITPRSTGLGSSGVIELHGEPPLGGGPTSAEVIELGAEPSPSPSRLRAYQEEESTGIEDDLEEAEFFIQQNLFSEARNILEELSGRHPKHPLVQAKLEELISQEEKIRPTHTVTETKREEIATDLATELADGFDDMEQSEVAHEVGSNYSVDDIFEEFKKGVTSQITDEDSDTHYDLGIAYREMGLLDDAIAEFKVAMRSREKEVLCHMMIGLCYAEKDLFAEAISQFKTGLYVEGITDRETIALYFELGQAYERLEDYREALYYYEKVSKKDTRFRDVSNRVGRLSKLVVEEEAPNSENKESGSTGSGEEIEIVPKEF